jgi:hypothetical protein
MKFFVKIILILLITLESTAQSDSLIVVNSVVLHGDTIPLQRLSPVYVFAPRQFESAREERQYGRLKRYVVKVYPYAKVAGQMLEYFDDTLQTFRSENKRKAYLKKVEEELKEEFGGELKKLTIKQGIILVKLIDRETGSTSYDLIKQLRGSFSAFIWQSLARLFGSNLKLEYDPYGEDALIEEIVVQIEAGIIPYQPRNRHSG